LTSKRIKGQKDPFNASFDIIYLNTCRWINTSLSNAGHTKDMIQLILSCHSTRNLAEVLKATTDVQRQQVGGDHVAHPLADIGQGKGPCCKVAS
jgi:hypothetical protein